MVAGETEAILAEQIGNDNYDDFLFGKRARARRAKRRSRLSVVQRKEERKQRRFARKTRRVERRTERQNSPTRIMRKERRSAFFKDLGTAYRNAGRATGIGAQIDALTPQLEPNFSGGSNTLASDYTLSVGGEQSPKEKSGIPKVALIVGGVVVLGIIGVVAMKPRNQ
ncbi:hypothetical protein [uncultured Algibacter sp.]|uniref:hypothetical protein n=1 Tax=uncultured Algibacter sp. TaxID=298659 RepID=UPI003216A972